MAKLPYMKWYPGDFHRKTRALSQLAKANYAFLLWSMWEEGGRLPNDQLWLRRSAGCDPRYWPKIWAEISRYFDVSEDGLWLTQARVSEDLDRVRKHTHKSTLTRESRDEGFPEENQTPKAPSHAGARQKSEVRSQKDTDTPTVHQHPGDADDWPKSGVLPALVKAVGSPFLDPVKTPGLVTTAGRIAAWRSHGYAWQDVVAVVTALAAKHRGEIKSWAYFDGALADAWNARNAPLPTANLPALTGPHHDHDRRSYSERAADHHQAQRAALGRAFAKVVAREQRDAGDDVAGRGDRQSD